MTKVFLQNKIQEVLENYEPRIDLQSVKVDDDQDNNRLVVDIYFYVVVYQVHKRYNIFTKAKIIWQIVN